jgi:hypothetical protein
MAAKWTNAMLIESAGDTRRIDEWAARLGKPRAVSCRNSCWTIPWLLPGSQCLNATSSI